MITRSVASGCATDERRRTTTTARPSRVLAALAVITGLVATVPATAAAAPSVQVSATPITASLSTRATTIRIAVQNTGTSRASGLTVAVSRRKGVRVTVAGARRGRTSRRLRPLRAGATTRVTVRVRRLRGGPTRGSLPIRVTRRGRTLARARLSFGAPATPPAPKPDPNSLAGRYFWGSQYTINGIEQYTLYFAGPNLVNTAAMDSAWAACAAVTETCRPYAYDAATTQLTIDGKPATLTGRSLTLDGQSHYEFGYPVPGARWDVVVTYSNSSGICPLMCSYYTENLTFRADGTFIRDAVSSGTGPIVDWTAIPPDRKGTYEVRADHTLLLAFADGTQRVETVGLYLNDDGTLKPPGEGIILGGDGYFDIRD